MTIPTAARNDGSTTPPPPPEDRSERDALVASSPYVPQALQPYSGSQVAFLELYNLLVRAAQEPEPLAAQIDELLRQGAADGIYAADGTTLLHAAAMYASALEGGANVIMRSLVRAKPEQCYVASKSLGYLPLHYAACNAAPLEVIQTLFEAHPAACTTSEKKGLTPAQLADKMGNTVRFVGPFSDVFQSARFDTFKLIICPTFAQEISRVLGRMWERERRAAKQAEGSPGSRHQLTGSRPGSPGSLGGASLARSTTSRR